MQYRVLAFAVDCGESRVYAVNRFTKSRDLGVLLFARDANTATAIGFPALLQESVIEFARHIEHEAQSPLLAIRGIQAHAFNTLHASRMPDAGDIRLAFTSSIVCGPFDATRDRAASTPLRWRPVTRRPWRFIG